MLILTPEPNTCKTVPLPWATGQSWGTKVFHGFSLALCIPESAIRAPRQCGLLPSPAVVHAAPARKSSKTSVPNVNAKLLFQRQRGMKTLLHTSNAITFLCALTPWLETTQLGTPDLVSASSVFQLPRGVLRSLCEEQFWTKEEFLSKEFLSEEFLSFHFLSFLYLSMANCPLMLHRVIPPACSNARIFRPSWASIACLLEGILQYARMLSTCLCAVCTMSADGWFHSNTFWLFRLQSTDLCTDPTKQSEYLGISSSMILTFLHLTDYCHGTCQLKNELKITWNYWKRSPTSFMPHGYTSIKSVAVAI